MSWNGYVTIDGLEFINAPRTEAYAASSGAAWLRPQFKNPYLPSMLGQADYTTPLLDPAPWTDPDLPQSYDFFGIYPLDITGLENSSRSASPVEATIDGGTPGRLRHAIKTVEFSVALIGANEKAVAYGAEWMRRVLFGDLCTNPDADKGYGVDLTFLSSAPLLGPADDPIETFKDLYRVYHRFEFITGPEITSQRELNNCDGVVWTATFTGVAGNPIMFGWPRQIINGWLDGAAAASEYLNRQPQSSFEDAAGWTMTNGAITYEVDDGAPYGATVLRGQVTTGGSTAVMSPSASDHWVDIDPSEAGQFLNVYADMWWDSTNPVNPNVRFNVAFRDAAQALIGTASNGPLMTLSGFDYGLKKAAFTIPANTEWAQVRVYIQSGVVGDSLRMDGLNVIVDPTNLTLVTPSPPWTPYPPEVTVNPDPWAPGTVTGPFDNDPDLFDEVECGVTVWTPIYDPLCPALSSPPAPPSLPVGCFEVPAQWERYQLTIPNQNIPTWRSVVPILSLYAPVDMRNVRVRFYDDPLLSLDPDATPCGFSYDLVFTYIPAEAVITLDGENEEIRVTMPTGDIRRADSLLINTHSEPIDWPRLSCNAQQIITLDVEVYAQPPIFDLELVPRIV